MAGLLHHNDISIADTNYSTSKPIPGRLRKSIVVNFLAANEIL